jgi:iron-sulfur cluster repair protein YtfE (RIC family)
MTDDRPNPDGLQPAVRTTGDPQPTSPGEALFQELLWVHDMLRRDLATVRELADRVAAGLETDLLQAALDDLRTNSALWKFRANCLYYCRFVHHHHTLEDEHMFPALRRSDPALAPVVDTLEADHRRIAEDLHAVQGVARRLASDESPAARAAMVTALSGLADRLLTHLSYEEDSIGPALRAWQQWPP